MEKPLKVQSLDQSRAEKGICEYPKSPEFEFWMVRNPSMPQPNILTADQLFSDGVLLPFSNAAPVLPPPPEVPVEEAKLVSSGPELTAAAAVSEPATGSRRWKNIFKKSESKSNSTTTDQKLETPKVSKQKHHGGGQASSAAAELNINIWPFSRSRSAKTGSTRPKATANGRKVSSAPCSRSNSGSESKSRKGLASPARGGGVHVGRSSPVWQARRGGGSAAMSRLSVTDRESVDPGGGKGKNSKRCNRELAAVDGGDIGGSGCREMGSGGSHEGSGVVNLFNFRNFFGRKVY